LGLTLGRKPLAFQLKLKEMELNRLRPFSSFKGTRGNATTETATQTKSREKIKD